ncbi:hypothetical protein ACFXTH_006715 [Malus domestica]
MQGDASLVINALQSDGAVACNGAFGHILNDARLILKSVPHWKVRFGQRDMNKVVYRFARLGLILDDQVSWFEKPLNIIFDILFEDDLTT